MTVFGVNILTSSFHVERRYEPAHVMETIDISISCPDQKEIPSKHLEQSEMALVSDLY
jgi:hypothetical protein